jgi:hopanoid biosynthesis associated RND transporter like protein HpnN
MNEPLQRILTPILQRWLGFITKNATAASGICILATIGALVYAFLNLGINSDNLSLISEDLPSRKNQAAFAEIFPSLEEAILIVIDGETPALARDTTNRLAERLETMDDVFKDVYVPGGGSFFEDHALLYLTADELDDLADDLAALQPVIASLEADPSLVKLAELVSAGLEAKDEDGIDADRWAPLLDEVANATVAAYARSPIPVSWEAMLVAGSDLEIPTRRVIVVDPWLDYDKILVAGSSMAAIEGAMADLGLDQLAGVQIRMTGNPALNHEEMLGLAWDIGGSGVFCFLLVAGFLYFAFRSWHLVIASLITLLVGLIWTAAFAAATIGQLNIISIAFAILFIGLGVDFAIHFGMAFAAERRDHRVPNLLALQKAVDGIGASLVLCGFTTAIGFLVFVPTEYRGIAELGAIAGAGMFIILFLTLTLFPALLSGWLQPPVNTAIPAPFRVDQALAIRLGKTPRLICGIAMLSAILATPLLFQLKFDAHVIKMRNPDTQSVQAFQDLLADEDTSPWYVNVLAPNLDEIDAIVDQLEALPEIGRTVSLRSYVPEEQDDKLEILDDLAFLMEAVPHDPNNAPSYDTEEQTEALRELLNTLRDAERPSDNQTAADSFDALERNLSAFLVRIEGDENPDKALGGFRDVLLDRLPEALERFRNSLAVSAIEVSDLPPVLVRRLLAPDGTARIQAFPADALQDFESLKRFSKAVLGVAPLAAGMAPHLVDFGEATARSFRQALLSAAVAISALLFLLWRRPPDVALVLAPLVLGGILTCASMALLDLRFNFANIVVLPLLFGIGVDSGIHLVHRARHDATSKLAGTSEPSESLVETATAGAVFYSAMTTTLSFGTLALSGHQGMHSLGVILTIGMFWNVVANLVVLPALLSVSGVYSPDAQHARAPRSPVSP